MRRSYVALALRTGQSLSELLEWHPRDVYTALDILEEQDAAAKRASK